MNFSRTPLSSIKLRKVVIHISYMKDMQKLSMTSRPGGSSLVESPWSPCLPLHSLYGHLSQSLRLSNRLPYHFTLQDLFHKWIKALRRLKTPWRPPVQKHPLLPEIPQVSWPRSP
jgi:hypothetical protein